MIQFLKNVFRFLKKVLIDCVPVFILHFIVVCIVGYYEHEPLTFAYVTPFIVVLSFLLGALYNHCSKGNQE